MNVPVRPTPALKQRKENLLYADVNKFLFKLRSFLYLLIYTCTPTVFFYFFLNSLYYNHFAKNIFPSVSFLKWPDTSV